MAGPPVPAPIRALTGDITARGARIFLVGGGVRDHLMGRPVKDWDVEVFGLEADELAAILRRRGRVNLVGRSFGVFKWTVGGEAEIDVSIPRKDSKVGPGHRGIAVEGDPHLPVREAARRRDLTINALLWDLQRDELEDPWGGLEDLRRGVLRAVDEQTFLEDPLRALRVAQFVARLGFRADDALVALCRRAALDELPAERVGGEWAKLLLKGKALALGLAFAREAELVSRLFPGIAELDSGERLDGFSHRRDHLEPEGRRLAAMLAIWLWPAREEALDAVLDRLGVFSARGYAVRERLLAALAHRDAPIASDADLRRLSTRAELRLLLEVRGAWLGDTEAALARAEALGITEASPRPLLLGRDLKALGVPPGPAMGDLLDAVYRAQLDGLVSTEDEARLDALRRLTP